MEQTIEFKLILKILHETNKQSHTREIEFESYEDLSNWLEDSANPMSDNYEVIFPSHE